jgi:protein TonB
MGRHAATKLIQPDAGGVVVAFPGRRGEDAFGFVPRGRPPVPDRPANWFAATLLFSLAVHVSILAATYWQNTEGLARPIGSAIATASDGTATVIEVEVVADSTLPAAPAPVDATAADAKTPAALATETDKAQPAPEQRKAEPLAPKPPDPSLAEAIEEPQPPEKSNERTKLTERSAVEETAAPRLAVSAPAAPARPAASLTTGTIGNRGQLDTGGPAVVSSYQAMVLAHLSRFRTYPEEARSRGVTGVVSVRFALASDGKVVAALLLRTSGATILDDAALAMVRRASPFPPFPPGLNRARMEFAAPIRFDLR